MTIEATQRAGKNEDGAASKIERYRVHRGEPGRNIMTEFKDGYPVIEKPLALAPPPSSLLPAIIPEESRAVILSPQDKKANFRFALVKAYWEEISQKPEVKKRRLMKQFLRGYNSGTLLPDIFKNLGKMSRPTLYRMIEKYKLSGVEGLVHQYRGPKASGITPAEEQFLENCFKNPNKPTIGHCVNKCKYLLGEQSPSHPSRLRRWLDQFQKEHYDECILVREGEKALKDKCLPYAERDWRKLKVGDCLVADGHVLNFRVKNPFTGDPTRAVMVLFWDWKSSFPCGFEIMLTESIQCVVAALRNAIITLGRFPTHVLLDNGKAFRANIFREKFRFQETEIPGIFDKLGIIPHFSQPYNPQSKPIERFFRTFNDWCEREVPSYVGASIADKPAYMKRNEKWARDRHNEWIPTIPEATELIFKGVDYYVNQQLRGRDYLRPKDIFESEKGPGVDPFALHFLMMTCKARMVHRNGITFSGWHWYHENLYGFKDYVIMFYSYYDLSQVYIYTLKGEFLCVAKPREKLKPFAADSEFPEDMAAVKRHNAETRKLVNSTKKNVADIQSKQNATNWNRLFHDNPKVAEALQQIEDAKPKESNNLFLLGKPGSPAEENIQNKDEIVFDQKPGEIPILFIDPRTNLSRPSDGTVFKDEFEYYEWYRAINEKFPGILNNEDWKKIEEYELTDEWEDFYGKRGIPHMVRAANGKQPQEDEQ